MLVETTRNNGCGSEGCNVLQIVGVQIKALADAQVFNTQSVQTLIIEKFDNMEKNNAKESNRIDELRKGDIEAVRIANDSTVKRAELLDKNLIETAETVRKNTDTLASTLASQLQSQLQQIMQITARQDEKIAALERINWENSGKAGAAPDIQKILTDLVNAKYTSEGIAKGQQLTKNGLIAILGAAMTVFTIITIIINFFRG